MSSLDPENNKRKAVDNKKKRLKRKKPIWSEEKLPDVVNKVNKILSVSEKKDEAYKRITSDIKWVPPQSDICLIHQEHFQDPWKVMAICILLNNTTDTDEVCNVIYTFPSILT